MKDSIKISKLHKDNPHQFIELVALFNEVFEEYHTVGSKTRLKKLL